DKQRSNVPCGFGPEYRCRPLSSCAFPSPESETGGTCATASTVLKAPKPTETTATVNKAVPNFSLNVIVLLLFLPVAHGRSAMGQTVRRISRYVKRNPTALFETSVFFKRACGEAKKLPQRS